MHKKYWLLLLVLLSSFTACDVDDEPIPAYLHIENAQVADKADFGLMTEKITSVWVFVNNKSVGAYELPATIPVLEEGEVEVRLRPGINKNGLSTKKIIYPLMEGLNLNVQLTPAQTTSITPVFSYSDDISLAFLSLFETGSNFVVSQPEDNSLQLSLTNNPEIVLEGARSACLNMDTTLHGRFFELKTSASYSLPGTQNPVFLELDYQNDTDFQVLINAKYSTSSNVNAVVPVIYIASRELWNKIYIDLTEIVTPLTEQGFDSFQILFRGEVPVNQATATWYWDNLKLIHQQ